MTSGGYPRTRPSGGCDAVLAKHRGELVAPPRVHTELGAGRLVFTTGSLAGDWFGYRSYATFGGMSADQLVVVQDANSGTIRGIAVGTDLVRSAAAQPAAHVPARCITFRTLRDTLTP